MRLILVVVALIASVFAHSASFDNLIVKDNRVANDVVIRLISSGVISDTPADNNNIELAQKICLAGGGTKYSCVSGSDAPKTLAQGICLAGGGTAYSCVSGHDAPKNTQEALRLVTNSSGASDILEDPSTTSSPTRVINAGKNTYVTNGRTTTGSDGSIYSTNRSRTVTIGSDGSIYTTTGNVTIGSNGEILVTSGNTTTSMSGLTCVDIGTSINCN